MQKRREREGEGIQHAGLIERREKQTCRNQMQRRWKEGLHKEFYRERRDEMIMKKDGKKEEEKIRFDKISLEFAEICRYHSHNILFC